MEIGWCFEIENSRTFKCNLLVLVTKIGNENWKKNDLYQTVNIKIVKIASNAEYRIKEQFQNCLFLEPNFGFANWKNSRNLFIFQFKQFQKFVIRKIRKICNFENAKNYQFWKIQTFAISKMRKISNFEKSKNISIISNFGKLPKFLILKISNISQILQFRKSSNFWVWKMNEFI